MKTLSRQIDGLSGSERFAHALAAMSIGSLLFEPFVSCNGTGVIFLWCAVSAAFTLVTSILFGRGWRHRHRPTLIAFGCVFASVLLAH